MNELKEYFSINELGNANACKKSRDFSFALNTDANVVRDKARITKVFIRDYLNGLVPATEIHNRLSAEFALLPFKNRTQMAYQLYETERQCIRYINYAVTFISDCVPYQACPVEISKELKPVYVSPDFVTLKDGVLTVIKIATGKAPSSTKKEKLSLKFYALLKYGRLYADSLPSGTVKVIRATYHYLRKSTDTTEASRTGKHFDSDFLVYENEKLIGNNVLTVEEANVINERNATDFDYEENIKDFIEGKDDCTKEDCQKCLYNALCKYNEAPLAIVKERAQRSITEIALSPSQEAAVDFEKGILRVIAGAGAGKTLTVALRVAVLIQKGYRPSEILMMTFSNAGAEEMRERIGLYMNDFGMTEDPNEITCTTFNSFGYEIIKKEYERFGFTAEPAVIDDIDRSRIITKLLNTHTIQGLDYRNFMSNMKSSVGALEITKKVFDIIKKNNYTKGDIPAVESELGNMATFLNIIKTENNVYVNVDDVLNELFDLYYEYDRMLISENLLEFADQEVLLFRLLEDDPFYLENLGYKHIIVDEFQDTSMKQMELIKKIRNTKDFTSLMVVGDDAQAIYSFRDTSPEYIIHFPEIMGESITDIPQLENHRSTPEVIEFANKIHENNTERIEKDLVATRPSGAPVVVKGFLTKEDEINYVVEGAVEHFNNGVQTAVICATNEELNGLALEFNKKGVQTVMLNPQKYAENSRVIASIALSKFMRNYTDTDDAVIYENCKIGGGAMNFTTSQIEAMVEDAKIDAAKINSIGNPFEKKQAFIDMCKALDGNEDEVFDAFIKTLNHKATIEKVFEYLDDFHDFGTDAAVKRTHDYPGIVLTTAHSSKGLEWPCVYNMISKYWTKGLRNPSAIEEKRRLLFVSATRARDELYVTGQYICEGNAKDGYTPNPFLVESIEAVDGVFDLGSVITQKQILSAEASSKRRMDSLKRSLAREKILKAGGPTIA